jgi:dTMP kinase
MRFVVIEGLDGSGKSTQVDMLAKYLERKGVKYKYLHFPRLEVGIYGALIARFLRGEMGTREQVDPYLVALIFAGDRKDAADLLLRWINEGYLVIVDRYVYSNISFQCAKLSGEEEQNILADWIMELEYGKHQLPVPDTNIFLDVPFEFTRQRLTEQRDGDDRQYLKGREDIHENDLNFQEKVRRIYHSICREKGNLDIVDCTDKTGAMKSPDKIFEQLISIINV